MKRYLLPHIIKDLKKKMVFVGGPRQVGKTTMALDILHSWPGRKENSDNKQASPAEDHPAYFNWDNRLDKKALLDARLAPDSEKLIVLDEIHKYKSWRGLVKGFYDKQKNQRSFLVTGSARLDYYRRGGDSLQGRYHYYRLHPLSLGELLQAKGPLTSLDQLLKFGGFPEPYFEADETHWRRWQRERASRVFRDDLITLEKVVELSSIELLNDLLPTRVGAPLSIKSLAEDLEVAHKTVARWLKILENLYLCFRLAPFGSPKIRAVKKEQKLYLWDWSLCESEGARFENLVACQLLKYCHLREDTEGHQMDLCYLRDTDKREVDFVVLMNKKPLFAVEAKLNDSSLSPHLQYFSERTKIPTFYQVCKDSGHKRGYKKGNIEFLSLNELVVRLKLP